MSPACHGALTAASLFAGTGAHARPGQAARRARGPATLRGPPMRCVALERGQDVATV